MEEPGDGASRPNPAIRTPKQIEGRVNCNVTLFVKGFLILHNRNRNLALINNINTEYLGQ